MFSNPRSFFPCVGLHVALRQDISDAILELPDFVQFWGLGPGEVVVGENAESGFLADLPVAERTEEHVLGVVRHGAVGDLSLIHI